MRDLEQPLFFGPSGESLFGWLHGVRDSTPRLGVVVCSTLGSEEMSAHRSVRHLACAAAAAGIPTLRFDYPGCGDSTGEDTDPDRVAAWVASIHHAIDTLKNQAQVSHVALLGVRIGALLAGLAATQRRDIAALVSWSGLVAGRSLVREWKALSLASGFPPHPDGDIEAGGFVLTGTTCATLSAASLMELERPPAPALLIVDRDDLPGNERWLARLHAQGAVAQRVALPGFAQMLQVDPHHTEVPRQIIEHTVSWLQQLPAPEAAGTPPRGNAASGVLILDQVREEAIVMDDGGCRLFGLLSEPRDALQRSGTGILLLSSGANRHIGPNRMYVSLARQLAAQGHQVLRIDLSGLGDSDTREGHIENRMYAPAAVADVDCAIAYLARVAGVVRVHSMGVCSGAYHSFKAAARGAPLSGALAINPLVFFWKEGMSIDADFQEHEVARHAENYKRSLFSLVRWRKLLRGEVALGHLAGVLAHRLAVRLRHRARALLRAAGVRLADDLAGELLAIERHGVAMRFLFSQGDPGWTMLHEQAHGTVARLTERGRLDVQTVPGADHNLTTRQARMEMLARIERAFPPPPHHEPTAPAYAVRPVESATHP